MEPSALIQTPGAVVAEPIDPVLSKFKGDPHQAFSTEDLVRALEPKSSRDPEKLAAASENFKKKVQRFVDEGHLREVGPGLFKARLFFDAEKRIEHAFTGGFGNTVYSFSASLFRLNIGVLSIFFVKDQQQDDWIVTIRDTTIGKDYCLPRRVRDGQYAIGRHPPKPGEENYFQVEGRYIDKRHMMFTLSGDKIDVEDNRTLSGTRIDHLTGKGIAQYRELAKQYLKQVNAQEQGNVVKRGRFVLDQLQNHHQNFESAFFGAVVDSLQH